MWLVNTKENAVYMLSAKYRTTYGSVGDTVNYPGYESVNDNYYIITKFNLPSLSAGEQVVLTPTDIIDQFTTDFAAFATPAHKLQFSLEKMPFNGYNFMYGNL